ncbi:MAG: 4-hydroxy-tetrahydrodipicolinate synthase [Gammaproteobacteria bacterium]|jgi:4-hydroxy-tetrahydrodipicolinate synthase|nr:4-hydroxy-tetrahydrodipicolinate synthase [Gammaproteobacteria bacterium]
MRLTGSIIAIVTPMQENGDIDFAAFEKLIEWQISQGCDGIVVAGSTGEGATLSAEERLALFALAQKIIAGRVPLIAYPGTNNTRESIELAKATQALGIEYALMICPYYNKPTQEGIYLHYKAIAEATPNMKHILYSIPGRCIVRIENETVARLATLPNIVGLKDSGGTAERIRLLRASCGPEFSLLSGDDDFTLSCIEAGGDGVISVAANALPKEMQALVSVALNGDKQKAQNINTKLQSLLSQLFCQSNPIPLKALLHHLGKIPKGIRLPLTWLEPQFEAGLYSAYDEIKKTT